jgi:hypothetical protein
MKRKTILGLIAVVAIVAVAMFSGCVEEPKYEEGAGTPTESKNLEILDHHMETGEFGNLIIKGTAKNIGSSSLSYAEVRVKFYDKEGTLLDTSLDNINDLGPGETWNFKDMYLGTDTENVDSYKIAVGSVF